MKLIAKTFKGKEYIYSKIDSYFVSDASSDKICKILNDNNYQLKENEIWHVYEHDHWTQDMFVQKKMWLRKGMVKARWI